MACVPFIYIISLLLLFYEVKQIDRAKIILLASW